MVTNICIYICICSPLVDTRRKRESQYILNGYIAAKRQPTVINGKEYILIYYQGDHKYEYLSYPNDHTGVVRLYKNGVVSLEWKIQDGRRVGDLVLYENGCAVMKESWDSIFGSGDCYGILFTEKGTQLAIEDSVSHQIVYVGGYNNEMQRNGRGIEYNPESGKEQFEGIWSNDKLQRILKFFEEDKMIELSESSPSLDTPEWKPIYMGGYFFDECTTSFLRHGQGCKIDPERGLAYSKGEWNLGEEVSSKELLDGMFLHQKVVKDEADLSQLPASVEELVTLPDCCNRMSELNFSWLSELKSLSFGDRCFENISTFKLNGLNQLRRVRIGNFCFTPPITQPNVSPTPSLTTAFQITNCPMLRVVEIGVHSFREYAGDFEVSNLPRLEELRIGLPSENSFNFFHSDFLLRSTHPARLVTARSSPAAISLLGLRSLLLRQASGDVKWAVLRLFRSRFALSLYHSTRPLCLAREPKPCYFRK